MILLVTSAARAQDCATAIQEATTEGVQIAASLRQAMIQLRAQEFSAVVLDQSLLEADPSESDIVIQHLGSAVPLQVNFGISAIDRVVRELQAALQRQKKEIVAARQRAEQALRSELKGTITALLLSCQLALEVPNLPATAEVKVRQIHELAGEMSAKLSMVT